MSKPVVTAADVARAEKFKSAVLAAPGDRKLAELLAEIREEAILCAVTRAERMYTKAKVPLRAPRTSSKMK